jgi:hypothetical protein
MQTSRRPLHPVWWSPSVRCDRGERSMTGGQPAVRMNDRHSFPAGEFRRFLSCGSLCDRLAEIFHKHDLAAGMFPDVIEKRASIGRNGETFAENVMPA